jgi:hypothetical protein
VEIDGQDQSEVWGSFRAGRLARPTLHEASDDGETIVIDASHDGYRHLPGVPMHRRVFRITQHEIGIEDHISGDGVHRIVSYLHLPYAVDGATDPALAVRTGVDVADVPDLVANRLVSSASAGFGHRHPVTTLQHAGTGRLPMRICTRFALPDSAKKQRAVSP